MARTKLPRRPNRLDPIANLPPLSEQLLAMIVGLASETAILRARLDTCERLLADAGVVAPGAIDGFEPDAAAQAEREAQRSRLLRKVFRPLQEAAELELAAIDRTGGEAR